MKRLTKRPPTPNRTDPPKASDSRSRGIAPADVRAGQSGRRIVTGVWLAGALLLIKPAPGVTTAGGQISPVSAPESLTVEQVVQEVIRHNDRVLAARFMEEAARRRVAPAGAWDDPMLMAGVVNLPTSFDFEEDMMTMTMIGVSQTIPFAGEKGLQGKAARKEAEAAREERRFTQADIAVAAKMAYYDLFYRTAIVADLERLRGTLEQMVESATAKLRANQAGQDEALSAQAELWRLDSMILSAEQRVAAARYALNSLRGAEPSSHVVLPAMPRIYDVPVSPDPWIETAEESYPPLRALEYRSESYAFSAGAARRMRWPMLSLSGSYGFRADTPEMERSDMVSLSASLSLPLFKGRRQEDMALSMDAMQRGASAEAVQMRREVRSEILTLHEMAVRSRDRLDLYRKRIIPTAEDAYESALSGYVANRTSFIALLTYTQAIIRDSITASEIANELAMTVSEVERYTRVPEITSGVE